MHKVKSTNIDWISYNAETETMEVCFKSGAIYSYDKVKEGVYNALRDAKSCGSHFAKHIKNDYKGKLKPKEDKKKQQPDEYQED